MPAFHPLLAALALAFTPLASAGTPTLSELGRLVSGSEQPGDGGYAIADFDGDGRDDLVVPSRSVTALFQVYGMDTGGIVSKQAVLVPDARFTRVIAIEGVDGPELATISGTGVVRRFAGWPLAEVQALDLGAQDLVSAAIGDIDDDGELDLVVSDASTSRLSAHVLATGVLRWELENVHAEDLMLAQLDADAALEIVAASVPGVVIDGATQAVDWSWPAGFGAYLAPGRFQPGGGAQFVAAETWFRFTVFQSAPWQALWQAELGDIEAIHAADLDGDGIDEIIEGDGQWGDVHVYDSATQSVRFTIPRATPGMNALDDWDADGDGMGDIVFSPQAAYHPDEALVGLYDRTNGAPIWEVPNRRPGPYHQLAIGPVGGTTPSIVFAAHAQLEQGPAVGPWVQLDAESGAERWQSPTPTDPAHPFAMRPRVTRIVDAAGPSPQLLLAGEAWGYAVRYVSLDAATRAVRWSLDYTDWPALEYRDLVDVKEVHHGGSLALVSCHDLTNGSRLFMMDAHTGAPLWESVVMSFNSLGCLDVLAGPFEKGGDPLVAAVFPESIRAFNASTHLLEWIFTVESDGASLIEGGVDGHELVVFQGSHLRFYHAASRTLLRQFDLGMAVTALSETDGDIHHLLVAAGGHLLLVDGTNGSVLQISDYLGYGLAQGNELAIQKVGSSTYLVAAGSASGVFRYRLALDERVFDDGFEPIVD